MSRRLEITVPSEWAEPVRKCLNDEGMCNLNDKSGKPHMIVELNGEGKTIFFVTVPAPSISPTLEQLRKNGIGVAVGRIILTNVEFLKPDLSKPLQKAIEAPTTDQPKPPPLKGFQHFQKARRTTEELYAEINNAAAMNMNTWSNLIGASMMAAGGLTSNTTVFIVAAMLVSPIMGPILGITFGYRIADWGLMKMGIINEFKMAVSAYAVGAMFGLLMGEVGDTYKWPNDAMMPQGQGFNLIISIIVSAAAGVVLAVSLTSAGGNALVGTAISAGLLPPLVNAGMLMMYAATWCPKAKQLAFHEMGVYSVFFYLTHVITIVVVANLVFWIKAIDPRFREGEDSNFDDIESLRQHKERLAALGANATAWDNEKLRAEYFMSHVRDDLQDVSGNVLDIALNIKDRASGLANVVTGGLIGSRTGTRARRRASSTLGTVDEGVEVANPLGAGASVSDSADGDVEMGTRQGSAWHPFKTRPFVPINATEEEADLLEFDLLRGHAAAPDASTATKVHSSDVESQAQHVTPPQIGSRSHAVESVAGAADSAAVV